MVSITIVAHLEAGGALTSHCLIVIIMDHRGMIHTLTREIKAVLL